MKQTIKSLGILVVVAGLFASCTQKDMEVPANQLVGIVSDNTSFVDNAAQVKLLLAKKADKAVTVILGTFNTTSTFGKQLSASLLNIPESVTIAAGDSVAVANIAVDPSSLEKGKYQAVVGITGAIGAAVRNNASSVALNLVHGDLRPHVALLAGTSDITGDEGTLAIRLSTATEMEATLTIAVSAASEVPAAALSFDSEVSIAAGKNAANVTVKVDRSQISDSGLLNAVFKVSAVSDNLINDADEAAFAVFNAIPAKQNWQGTFYGPYTHPSNGRNYHAFLVNGVTDTYWDLVRVPKGSVEGEAGITDLILGDQADVEYYADYYSSNYSREQFIGLWLYTGGSALMSVQDPGEYEAYIVGFDADGYATGNYSSFEYQIEDDNPDPLPEYSQWIGNWDLNGTTIAITADKVNETLHIEGLELGIEQTVENKLGVTADFDYETGGISISAQNLGTWEHSDYGTAVDKLCGLVVIEGKTYYVDDPVVVAYVNMNGNGKAVWTPGSVDLGEEGASTIYSFVGLKYYWVVSAGAGRYSANSVDLPVTMSLIPDAEEESFSEDLGSRLSMPAFGEKTTKPALSFDNVRKLLVK